MLKKNKKISDFIINKSDYLAKTKGFIDFLAGIVTSNDRSIFKNGIISGEKCKKNGPPCIYNTFEELAESYYYDRRDLHATNSYLWNNSLQIKKALEESLSSQAPFDNNIESLNLEKKILGHCLEIMRWGGVNSPKFAISFVNNNLSIHLRSAAKFFRKTEIDKKSFDSEVEDRMNASFSKVYSLCCDIPFIIFDSRVAASFRLLAAAFFIKNQSSLNHETIDAIRFPALGDRISKKGVSRDLSHITQEINFKTLNANDTFLYAAWNARANWLLEAVVLRINTFCGYELQKGPKDKFCIYRSIEAGLFQLGYNLNDNRGFFK